VKLAVKNLSGVGLISDKAINDVPPNGWTAMQNIRIQDGRAGNFSGHSEYTTPTVTPYYLLPVAEDTNYYWIYMGLAKGYIYNGSTHTDITRAAGGDYTGTASDRWNGGVLNGIPVLNNGVDLPQEFTPVATTTDLDTLTAWDTNWRAKVIRPFKYFLVALNMTESSVEYPHKLRWSSSADPGSVPSAWTPASSNDAGSNVLGETGGHIVDGLALGDQFMIYKEDSVHGMQYIGGNDVFRFYRIPDAPGALAQDCMKSFSGGHFVVSKRDAYVTDGQSWRSVIDGRNRNALFSDMDGDNYASTYVAHNRANSEMWVCYPGAGASLPNKAFVWNYFDDVWYQRDLPTDTAFIQEGIITESGYTWDTLPYGDWGLWTGTWSTRAYSPIAESLVGASDTLYKFEDGNQFNGVNAMCYAEHTGLNIGDNETAHTVTSIYPYIQGGPVDIYIGHKVARDVAITWKGPYAFTSEGSNKLNVRVTGIYHGIKFQTEGNVTWGVSGYEIEYQLHSMRG
jgi:hypothetical protein